LIGLGISHQLIPVRQPQRNGAVERFHRAVEHSWRDEAGGLEALRTVWNVERPALDSAHQPYRGREGFSMERVWALLATVRVARRVDGYPLAGEGKFGLWNRPVRAGKAAAGQEVEVTFDAKRQRLVVSDVHAVMLREVELPWLTEDWLWEPVPLSAQAAYSPDTSTIR
jgi:hypothetical protein